MPDAFDEILVPGALQFVSTLARRFAPRIAELLDDRKHQQREWSAGAPLDFRADTAAIREGDWRIGGIPQDLLRRVVEITGPVDRKMIINALNSGADVFMADFEDCDVADLEQPRPGAAQSPRRGPAHHHVRGYVDRQAVRAQRTGRHADRAPARTASPGEPSHVGWRRHPGLPLRRWDVSLSTTPTR